MQDIEFINKAESKHGKKYDYSKLPTKFITSEKITIICPIHGEFRQRAGNHLLGNGCKLCGTERQRIANTLSLDEWKTKANEKHSNRYDYSKVVYKHSGMNVTIICPVHGPFEQIARNHLHGDNCPKCMSMNKYHYKYDNIDSEPLRTQNSIQQLITNIKQLIPNEIIQQTELYDVYIPNMSIAFMIRSLSETNIQISYYKKLVMTSEQNNIHLIQIFEDEWVFKRDLIMSRIKHILGITQHTLYGRKGSIRVIQSVTEERSFFESNHLQGYVSSTICYGLYYDNTVVAMMSFGYSRFEPNTWELLRFATLLNYNIIGGASKLLKHFLKQFPAIKSLISYADRRFTNIHSNLYSRIGFEMVSTTKPNYYIVNGMKRHNRTEFSKSELIRKFNCPETITEHQWCLDNGYYRIYDAGMIKFVYNR